METVIRVPILNREAQNKSLTYQVTNSLAYKSLRRAARVIIILQQHCCVTCVSYPSHSHLYNYFKLFSFLHLWRDQCFIQILCYLSELSVIQYTRNGQRKTTKAET